MAIYKPKRLLNDGSLEEIKFPLDSLDGSEDLTFHEIEISEEVTETSTNLVTGKGIYNAIKSANHGYVLEITASQNLNSIPYFTIPNLSTTDVANLAKAYTQQKPTFIHYVPTGSTPHYYRVDSANYNTSASSNFVAEVHIHVDINLVKTIGESLCLEILYQSNGSTVSVRSNPNILYQTTAFFNEVNEDLPNLSGASITSIVNESIVGDITKIIGYDNNGYVETIDVISRGFNDTENWITFCWKNKIYKMTYRNGVVSAELLKTGYWKPDSGIPKSDLASDVQNTLNVAVPNTRTINNKLLSSNITLSLDDVADGSSRKLSNYYLATNPNGYTKTEASTTNGNIKINGTETKVYELPSNVIQSGVATDNNYTNQDKAAVATIGDKQDKLNAKQISALNSGINANLVAKISTNKSEIDLINGKIPAQASSSNQLADKDFVNSSLNSIAAYFITKNTNGDSFATKAELTAATTFYSGGVERVPTRNDYCIIIKDESHDNATTRYIYNTNWEYQYTINETPLTAEQLAAINSGITTDLVQKITTNESNIATINSKLPVISIESGYLCIRTS